MIDGVATAVRNYAEVITSTEGMNAIVGTPRYPKVDYDCYSYPVVPYLSFNISRLVEGYRMGIPFQSKALSRLVGFKPDIIHTHCPIMSTAMGRVLRYETDAPIVFTYHTKFDEDIAKAVKKERFRKAVAKVLLNNIAACDEVWTVSHGAGENLKAFGYEGNYRVVENGVDFPKGGVSEEEAQAVTKGLDVPPDMPVFLFVGRIMKYKGLPLIIDALKILSKKGYDFRMVFIGGGVDQKEIKKQALQEGICVESLEEDGSVSSEGGTQGLPGKIIFTGPIRDRQVLRAWNTRAHLFLFPSTYDTNGIVVREAAACGLASVLIEGSCAAEDVTDGRNGYLIRETPEAMAGVLETVCRNPAHARLVGETAMRELYISWDESVKTALGYYEELIEKKKSGQMTSRKPERSEPAIKAIALLYEAGRNIRSVSL